MMTNYLVAPDSQVCFDLGAWVENNNTEEDLAARMLVTCKPFSLCELQPSRL